MYQAGMNRQPDTVRNKLIYAACLIALAYHTLALHTAFEMKGDLLFQTINIDKSVEECVVCRYSDYPRFC